MSAIRIEDYGAVRKLVLCRPDEFNTITPQLLGARAAVQFVLFVVFLYFGWLRK